MPRPNSIQEFKDGVLIRTAPLPDIPDEEIRIEQALQRLRVGRTQLRQDMQDAAAFATGSGALTAGQLTTALRQVAAGIARTDRAILDILLIAAYQLDDGND